MKVACIQIAAYSLSHAELALQRALQMIDEAAQGGAELVVLPECTYPAYFLGSRQAYDEAAVRPWDKVLTAFADKAKQHSLHLVVGLARPMPGSEHLLNVAVLFGPEGNVIGTAAKHVLWHFDQHWFAPGDERRVFDTAVGRVGMIICADGRMPEVARALALQGAQVIVDPTAWVTTGRDRATLTNPQFEYMIPTRALENGVWVIAANKVGLEADTILYCGRSCIIDPQGCKTAIASTDSEEVLFGEIDPTQAASVPLRRRPELYTVLIEPVESLPIARTLQEKLVPEQTTTRVAALQLTSYASRDAYFHRIEQILRSLAKQDVRLAVLPGNIPAGADEDATASAFSCSRLAEMSARYRIGIAATLSEFEDHSRYRTCFLWDAGEPVGKYRKTHADPGYAAGSGLPVFEATFGRVGVMLDEEGLLPEVARCLMLRGADIILWPSRMSRWPTANVARARADENKVFIVIAAPPKMGTAIIDPNGAVVAAGLPDIEQAIAAQIVTALARYKEMAPRTHVVHSRRPAAYRALIEEQA